MPTYWNCYCTLYGSEMSLYAAVPRNVDSILSLLSDISLLTTNAYSTPWSIDQMFYHHVDALTSDFFIILFKPIPTTSKELSVLLAIFNRGFYNNDVRSDVQSDDALQHHPTDVATKSSKSVMPAARILEENRVKI